MRFKSFHIGKLPAKPDGDAAEENDTLENQIASLEKHVNGKTRELEATEEQLKKLSNTVQAYEEEEGSPPRPHGPLGELTIEPEDQVLNVDEDSNVDTLLDEADEEMPVVEVIKAEQATVTKTEQVAVTEEEQAAVTKAEKKAPDEGEDNSLTDLFSQEEDDVNPLAALIESLPDVTPQELLDDLREIKEIMGE